MNRIRYIWTLISLIILFNSCSIWWYEDFDKKDKNYNKVPLHLISVGNTKQEVSNKLGSPTQVIGSKRYEKGIIEVWSYEKWKAIMGPDYKEDEYWLYFFNRELVQWGRPGDWQKEADVIYELRIR